MGDAIVPITSLCLLGSRTGETDPIDGKPLDDRRTGPAYAAAERMEIDLSATVGAGRRRRDGTVTAPPASLPPELKRSRNMTTMLMDTATPKKASQRARAALRRGRAPRSGELPSSWRRPHGDGPGEDLESVFQRAPFSSTANSFMSRNRTAPREMASPSSITSLFLKIGPSRTNV